MTDNRRFGNLDEATMLARLTVPDGRVDAVLDTDTFNEVDDQFALACALLSPERINLRAVTAAPFFNDRSSGPGDGMAKSYEEILRILNLLGRDGRDLAWHGAASYLPDRRTPVESDAVRRIVELARESRASGKLLYVIGIAALTNIASALLAAPDIADSIAVIWLGGQPHNWPDQKEFNYRQDIPAVQVLFDSGAPLVQVPCLSVAELVATTEPELDVRCRNLGALGEFLHGRTVGYMREFGMDSKPIWDVAATAFLTVPQAFSSTVHRAPAVNDDGTLRPRGAGERSHMMRTVIHIDRDPVFSDLFARLRRGQSGIQGQP